jgi:2-dehydropantoate 2-reductase
MRVAVVGAGAVGGVFGARLAAAGHDVWFIARGETLAALRSTGLMLDSVHGDLHLQPVQATDNPADIGVVDVVLVAVKATQIVTVAPTLRPLVGAAAAVIPLQNGVEASRDLAAALGSDAVVEGLCRVIAEQVAPGRLRHMAVRPQLEFGPRAEAPPKGAVSSTLEAFARAVQEAGMEALLRHDMLLALWEKFLFIEPIGLACAAAGAPYDTVRRPPWRETVDACLEELLAVGKAEGVPWPADAKARIWERYDHLPPHEMTSLARDLLAGRPGEFDAQTEALRRLAAAHGLAIPAHDSLVARLPRAPVAAR